MYIFVKFDCKDLKQYDFPFMDNTIIWIWITNKFNWEGGGGGVADNAVCFTKNRIWIEWQPKGEFFILCFWNKQFLHCNHNGNGCN